MAITVIIPTELYEATGNNLDGTWTFDFDGADYKIDGTWRQVRADVIYSYRINFGTRFAQINLLNFEK